jgi:hypothetical protein
MVAYSPIWVERIMLSGLEQGKNDHFAIYQRAIMWFSIAAGTIARRGITLWRCQPFCIAVTRSGKQGAEK